MMNPTPRTPTILLLVSDPLMRSVLEDLLKTAGYLVVVASSLGSAVDRVKELPPDLLIIRPFVDNMPGAEAARYLRTKVSGLRILIVAGLIDDHQLTDRNEVQHFEVFPNPFAGEDLLSKIKGMIGSVSIDQPAASADAS